MKHVTITVLVENKVDDPFLIAEQGLSLLVEVDNHKVLFDTGQGKALCYNARQLNISLDGLDGLVLSHGHYDHVGGLKHYLENVDKVKIIAHPYLFHKKYVEDHGNKQFIGIGLTTDELRNHGAELVLKSTPYEIFPGVCTSGEIARITEYEKVEKKYYEKVLESEIHDELHDEQALIIDSPKGLIILTGCCHAGIVNTCRHALKITKRKKIHAILGGLHLRNASEETIAMTIQGLSELDPDMIIPLHCTGYLAMKEIAVHFGARAQFLHVGKTMEFYF